jgi:hypothetical protein
VFLRLKIKPKGRHIDTIELMEAESQAVLNSLTEHGFQDACTNSRSAGNGAYGQKGTTLRVMVASRPKASSCPDGRQSLGNYGWHNIVFCKYVATGCK